MDKKLLGQCIAEFIGTGLLIFFGVGCVAALVVAGVDLGQWEISIIWGLGVMFAIYATGGVSGAHLNPAVTLALTARRGFEKKHVLPFITSQVLGAFSAAALVYAMYSNLFIEFESTNGILRGSVESLQTAGIFSTYPHPLVTIFGAFMVEVVITMVLMFGILALGDDKNGGTKAMMTPMLIGILIAIIGGAFGPLTGFAMNPARDFGPKLFAMIAGWGSVALTGGKAIPYFLIPIFGPIVGAQIGAFVYDKFISKNLEG